MMWLRCAEHSRTPLSVHCVVPSPQKVGRRLQDFDILQEILRLFSISNTIVNEGIQRHPPCGHSPGSVLSHERAGIGAMVVLACLILVQKSSWYFLQLLKMPRTFCLNGLYLLIFAVLKIKIEKLKKNYFLSSNRKPCYLLT